ncbi:MAG: hypothetical protein R3B49_09345 [Phycisphaerales bacterium]
MPADAGTVLAELDAAADAAWCSRTVRTRRADAGLGSVLAGVDPAAVLAGGGDPARRDLA